MSLVQLNAIREILDDAQNRLVKLVAPPPDTPSHHAHARAISSLTAAIGAVARLEQHYACAKADTCGDPDT